MDWTGMEGSDDEAIARLPLRSLLVLGGLALEREEGF